MSAGLSRESAVKEAARRNAKPEAGRGSRRGRPQEVMQAALDAGFNLNGRGLALALLPQKK